jgi:hypothetical protein
LNNVVPSDLPSKKKRAFSQKKTKFTDGCYSVQKLGVNADGGQARSEFDAIAGSISSSAYTL